MSFDVTSLRGRRADQRWNRVSVGDLLERLTWSSPDKTAIVGWDGAYGSPEFARVSYAAGDRYANQVANALAEEGLRPGDRVLLYCDNSVEAMLAMIGIAKAGMVAVPVNPLLAPDVLGAMELAEPALAIVDAGLYPRGAEAFRGRGLAPRVSITIEGEPVEGGVAFHDWIAPQPEPSRTCRSTGTTCGRWSSPRAPRPCRRRR